MSKVIQCCTGFVLLYSVIGQENLHHPLNQSDAGMAEHFSNGGGGVVISDLNWGGAEETSLSESSLFRNAKLKPCMNFW